MNKSSRDDKISSRIPASEEPGSIGVPPVESPTAHRPEAYAKSLRVPPVSSFKIAKRNLPHWQEPGSVYFLTWRCREGLILTAEARTISLEAVRYWDGQKWKVYVAVVMPDHVHSLVRPLPFTDGSAINLAEIIHSVKSFSAHQINKLGGAKGPFWQQELYDRIIRDENEFLEKWQYIRNNPVKQGLAERPEDYPWLYEKG